MNRRRFLKLLGLAAAAPVAVALAKAIPPEETTLVVTEVDREARSVTVTAMSDAEATLWGLKASSYELWTQYSDPAPLTIDSIQKALDITTRWGPDEYFT